MAGFRARRGELPEFTGISAPYEAPLTPSLALDTGVLSVAQCVADLLRYIETRFQAEPADSRSLPRA